MANRKKRYPVNPPQTQGRIAPGVLPGIAPHQLDGVRCKSCEGIIFTPISALKLASRFQAVSGQPTLVEFKLGYQCVTCQAKNQYDHPDLQQPEAPEETKPDGIKPGGIMSEVPEGKPN